MTWCIWLIFLINAFQACGNCKKKSLVPTILGYSRKKQTGRRKGRWEEAGEDMEFPETSQKKHVELPGLIKNEMEFLRVTTKKRFGFSRNLDL